MKSNIAIMGAGSWGTALAVLLSKVGHKVTLWTRFQEEADMINTQREQSKYLPGIKIPEGIVCCSDLEKAVTKKEMIVAAVPSQALRENMRSISRLVGSNQIIISAAKGIEQNTLMKMSEIILEEVPDSKVAVLSGPSHAEEVARGIPTTVVSASSEISIAKRVQDAFMAPAFRVYTNPDLTGVEMGGALKNVIALCAGISDGLGYGDNTKAALMTRGLTEIARLGKALGADTHTFAGLSGMGDLIVTCTSLHSRNRKAGMLIGQGMCLEEALEEVKMVVEGVGTTKAAMDLSRRYGVEMPIVEQAYRVLFKGDDPRQAVTRLMVRDKKDEIEDIFVD